MILDKNEMKKITQIFIKNGIYTDEISSVFPIVFYDILSERGTVNSLLSVSSEFKELNKRFHLKGLITDNLKNELKKIDTKTLSDYALYSISNAFELGDKFSDSSNLSINQLVISLLKLQPGDAVFDLGCGKGSFLLNVHKYCLDNKIELKDLFGIEINKDNALIAQANLIIAGANISFVHNTDFVDGIPPMYNKGFVFPPFGVKMPENKNLASLMFDYKFSNRNSYEWVFVDRLLNGLTGLYRKAVAILSPRCMFNETDKKYRDLLIKKGVIETIIELPAGCLNFTPIKPVLVVFSKENKGVNVVDATSLVDKTIGKFANFELDYKKVIELVKKGTFIENSVLLNFHSLAVSNLLAGKGEKFEGVPLKEFSEVFTGSQYTIKNFEPTLKNEPTGYRILTSSDINDGTVEWNKLQSIDYKDDKFDKYAVKQNDVVVTAKSSKVKTVVVDIQPKEKILVTGGMIIVRPNIKKLNPTYLKVFLDSEKGQLALKAIQRGSIIISINAKDLANILIPEAPIEKQNIISKKYNNKLSTYIALKEELAKIENQLRSFDLEETDGD